MRRARPRLPLSLVPGHLLCLSSLSLAQERPAITGIAFIRMYTADPGSSATFYNKTLGLGQAES
ncbi:hypothetical protein [Tunturiibacter gelidiferens]|uniref:hypothetical protein n=1 Tax=Tunturiibacter gelidiferens TaxID=3069689 RepID=UPI003D9B9892